MKVAVDMNLSPIWVDYLHAADIEADLGHPSVRPGRRSGDHGLRSRDGYVVFTHDLDFGNILAVTHARGPSVIQVRTQNPVPEAVGPLVLAAIQEHRAWLERGALLTIEPDKARARVLPIVAGRKT